MTLINSELNLTRGELINMIMIDNPDKDDWSKDSLVNMVTRFRKFSDKQYKWIYSKMKYIVNHNKKYSNYKKKVKGFRLED